jgi:hypothetical protein
MVGTREWMSTCRRKTRGTLEESAQRAPIESSPIVVDIDGDVENHKTIAEGDMSGTP